MFSMWTKTLSRTDVGHNVGAICVRLNTVLALKSWNMRPVEHLK